MSPTPVAEMADMMMAPVAVPQIVQIAPRKP
jgi:hypothetical protein